MAYDTASGPDPTLYLYTSLTAGSSHIITATSRLETILKANKIAFRAIDCATDEKARQLWGRKAKGKIIPGLVKYGQVIADIKEVEEWNEYGELHENIDSVSDLFGDTPMTDNPMPPPAPITTKDPLAKTSQPPSRPSSGGRHISISEPRDKDDSSSAASPARNSKDESPLNLAMRQAGFEAAAKAGQRKASGTTALKSSTNTSALPAKNDPVDVTPTATATKVSNEAEEPADSPEMTDAKTPAQLATEGAMKTSVGKIADNTEDRQHSSDSDSEHKSNEEQLLEARRTSSIAKVPSRLAQETSVDDFKSSSPEEAVSGETTSSLPRAADARPSHHRGSSLSEASKDEIKAIEEANKIKEESGEDSDSASLAKATSKSTIQATDQAEAEVMKGQKTQDQKAKDADAAGVSASSFLSPSSDAKNLNRLSTDSASVYSFFDTAFSPAPLFSGEEKLDLDLSFMKGYEKRDLRTSISTYGSNVWDEDGEGRSVNGLNGEHDATPRQSKDTRRINPARAPTNQANGKLQNDSPNSSPKREMQNGTSSNSPQREILPNMPVIAPLRTPARRQPSDPLLSSNRVSTPSSVPLPLNIRKSPGTTTSPTQSPQRSMSRSQPTLLTNLPTTPNPPSHAQQSITSPATLTTTTTGTTTSSPLTPSSISSPSESRTLRFKKSIRSLRSKKSTQKLADSPVAEMPPALPPQKQLRDLPGAMGKRSVSDTYSGPERKTKERERGKLLCF